MKAQLGRFFLCVLALLLPTTLFWPLAAATTDQTLPLYATPGIALSEVVALLVALLYLQRNAWHWPRLAWLFALLVGLALLTTPFAVSPRLALVTTLRWAIPALLFVALSQPNVPWRGMMRCFLLGLALQGAVAMLQFALQRPLGLPLELTLWPEQSGAAVLGVAGQRWLRGYGLTFHPNVLGGFLAVGLVVALPLTRHLWGRLLWLWLALSLLITFSRSAWLAVALTVPLLSLWLMRQWPQLRRSLLITLGGALLSATVVAIPLAPQLFSRIVPASTGTESYALDERAVLARVALDFINVTPMTGVGAGNFAVAMIADGLPYRAQPVHNVPLLLAAEIGLLGAVAWLLLWLMPIANSDLRRGPWTPTLLAAWLALCIIALWDFYPWGLSAGRLLVATLLAWWAQSEAIGDGVGMVEGQTTNR